MNVKALCGTLIVFVLIQYIPLSLSISCYQCEEQMGNQCEKNVRNVLTENCTGTFVCAKYIWKDANISTIHRRCAPESICATEKALATANRTLSVCTTCNSTLCNSGQNVQTQAITIFLTLCAVLYLRNLCN